MEFFSPVAIIRLHDHTCCVLVKTLNMSFPFPLPQHRMDLVIKNCHVLLGIFRLFGRTTLLGYVRKKSSIEKRLHSFILPYDLSICFFSCSFSNSVLKRSIKLFIYFSLPGRSTLFPNVCREGKRKSLAAQLYFSYNLLISYFLHREQGIEASLLCNLSFTLFAVNPAFLC